MKTLYRFKLNDDGQIETREIDDYEETGAFFVYKHNSATHWVDKHKLDKVFHRAVHTFNPDINKAKRIMYDTFMAKAKSAYDDYKEYTELAETVADDLIFKGE